MATRKPYPANRKSRGEIPLIDRFLPKVTEDTVSGCWIWNAGRDELGYGRIRISYKEGIAPAHRASWMLFKGPVPKGSGPKDRILILHKCDNPSCVNPDHLFLGTDADNCADRDKKERQARGSKSGKSKLNEGDVRTIRSLLSTGLNPKEIRNEYQISIGAINDIRDNRSWSWLK